MSGKSSGTCEPPSSSGGRTEWSRDDAFRGGNPEASTCEGIPGDPGDVPRVDGAVGRMLGDYLILERLGSGGMGVVYRALQKNARRLVALKLIRADWWGDSTDANDRQAEARFHNEAEALAQLEHDHIVPIFDVGLFEGVVYFSMRLIIGRSLGRLVRDGGPMDPRRAAAYIEPIARAVQYAHERGIVHRDLKPSNIMVDAEDRPILIDLGLCKSLEATDATSRSGRPMGTAEYMAPEQARGDRRAGASVDIYGLGATLLTLLTGQPPFSGSPPAAVLLRVIGDEPEWPRERDRAVGRELKAVCLKCLEKDPALRFESAGALAVACGVTSTASRPEWSRPARCGGSPAGSAARRGGRRRRVSWSPPRCSRSLSRTASTAAIARWPRPLPATCRRRGGTTWIGRSARCPAVAAGSRPSSAPGSTPADWNRRSGPGSCWRSCPPSRRERPSWSIGCWNAGPTSTGRSSPGCGRTGRPLQDGSAPPWMTTPYRPGEAPAPRRP